MVLPHALGPCGELRAQGGQHLQARIQLDAVALTIVKGNGFHAGVARQGVGQTGGGVLTTRKQNQSGGVHSAQMLADFSGALGRRFFQSLLAGLLNLYTRHSKPVAIVRLSKFQTKPLMKAAW